MITVGISSKGRLHKDSLRFLSKNKIKVFSKRGKRDLFGSVRNMANIKIVYLHAREIIDRLADNSLDIGISGLDLLYESKASLHKEILIKKKLNFGKAKLVIAVPDEWIDVETVVDLEEVAYNFKDKKKRRLRVATKYPNLTTEALYKKGFTQFKIVKSLGATEIYPFTGSSEIITDITSSGQTLKANNLKILLDGEILSSEACLMISKKSSTKIELRKFLRLFSQQHK